MTSPPGDPERPREGASLRGSGGVLAVDDSLRIQSAFVTLARVLRTVFAIAVPIVLVRTLDQQTFGQYKQIALLSATAVGALSLGLPGSLYYFVPREPRASQSLLVRSLLLLAGVGAAAGLAVVLGAGWLDRIFSAPFSDYRFVVGLLIAISVPESLVEVAAVVDRRARLAAAATGVFEALRSGLVVAAALWTGELTMVLSAVVFGLLLRLSALLAYLAWRRREHPDDRSPAPTAAQLRYALPFHSAALVGMARDQLHSYFVATQYATAQYAVYAIGVTPLPFLDKITQSVAEVVVVDASRNFALGRLDEVRRVWWRGSFGIALALVPAFVICEVFAADIVTLLYGADYVSSAPVMRVYLCVLLLSIPLSSVLLRASASPRAMIVADLLSLVGAITTLAVAATATRLGPLGAVGSMVAGLAIFHAVAGYTVARRVGVTLRTFLPWRDLGSLLLLCAAGAGLAAVVTFPLPPALRALAGPALGGALIAGALWRSRLLPEAERALVRGMLGKLQQRLARRRGGPDG